MAENNRGARRWEDVRAEAVRSGKFDPAGVAQASAKLDAFTATYDEYLDILDIEKASPEEDVFNARTRAFEDAYEVPLEAAYRMAFLEMRVENLLDELSLQSRDT
ncbi:hypothetical protein MU582_11970 [Nocardioidaceae bacterium SCSIO 66511]|nr:hypothetical protein MU582_11970 [Nocardioidaceae bacterium SCSIO 66511]